MARMWYAGSPADFTVTEDESNDDALVLAPDAELDVYDARTGGSAVTDLLDRTGSPVSSVTTSATGRVLPFQGPDGTSDVLWLDDGVEDRYAVVPHGPFLPLTGGELSGTLSAAAPTTASNVPILAREPDSATGDLGLPGYAGSDTGWRDVSADVTNATIDSGGSLQMRRSGYMVAVRIQIGLLPTGAGLGNIIYTPPAGWRASLQTVFGRGRRRSNPADIIDLGVVDGFGLYVPVVPSGSFLASVYWFTNDTWPTSLPGTQVTAPVAWS